ncbi:hypothetical protein [Acanthopleuribacter pedis]|uniref:Uncharacterized protein n=1 Tax=Acanthopleuribacter pedis TaxID=442870 RepID=A0A8J7QAE2_9BACT|nr:hypothetical protein [Acanthopleuribacter pedis]MBO1317141.1 hypothetical protein [Acanthopleuribacter pedis]
MSLVSVIPLMLMAFEKPAIVLPPDPMVVEDSALVVKTFNQYRQFLADWQCLLNYEDILKTVSDLECGTVETPLEDIKTCLESKGYQVTLVKAEFRPERPYFYTADRRTFGKTESFFEFLISLYCNDEAHVQVPVPNPQAPTVSATQAADVNFDAYLLGGRNGRAEDGYRVRLVFKRDSFDLLDVDTEEPIEIYIDDVIKASGENPFELVTRSEVLYLKFLDGKNQVKKRLENAVR